MIEHHGRFRRSSPAPSCPDPTPDYEIPFEHRPHDREFRFEKQRERVFFIALRKRHDRQVGRLADFQAAGGRFGAKRPGAEQSGHRQQESARERLVAPVQKPQLRRACSSWRQTPGCRCPDRQSLLVPAKRGKGAARGRSGRAFAGRTRRPPGALPVRLRAEAARSRRVPDRSHARSASRHCEARRGERSRPAEGRSVPNHRPMRRVLRGSCAAARRGASSNRSSSGISARWVESGSRLATAL